MVPVCLSLIPATAIIVTKVSFSIIYQCSESLKIYMEIFKVKIELVMKIYCFEPLCEFYLTCKSNF